MLTAAAAGFDYWLFFEGHPGGHRFKRHYAGIALASGVLIDHDDRALVPGGCLYEFNNVPGSGVLLPVDVGIMIIQ